MKKLLAIVLFAGLALPATAHAEATTLSPWSTFAHDSEYGGFAFLSEMGPYQAVADQAIVRTGKGPAHVYGDVTCYEEDPVWGPVTVGKQKFDFRYRVRRSGRPQHTLHLSLPNPGAAGCQVRIYAFGHGRTSVTIQARFIVPA